MPARPRIKTPNNAATTAPENVVFSIRGRMATFGGPPDFRTIPSEELALFNHQDLRNPQSQPQANAGIDLPMQRLISLTIWLILFWCGAAYSLRAEDINGIAAGIPEPEHRNAIVQLFNWRFTEVAAKLPLLKELGYSHVHVSPPQRSNERVWQWWGRYQPIDFSSIQGPLGNEAEFREMNAKADSLDIKIIVDVVLNHTIDVTEMPEPDFVKFNGNEIVSEKFPQFDPDDFHRRCDINDNDVNSVRTCWLSNVLADLKTETPHVRGIAKDYLRTLVAIGVDGFRFDAAKHIEPDFFADVLAAVPNTYAFGEVIAEDPRSFPQVEMLDFYDFPLVATMKQAFGFGGSLDALKNPASQNRALPGPKAVTFVRNHDIDRGQAGDRGLDQGSQNTYGIGWNGANNPLSESDIILAYAYIFGREDGLPYVFVDMTTPTNNDKREDLFDDKRLVAFIRFHNLCLGGQDGVARREDIFLNMKSPNGIGWQRGKDRLVVINKAVERLPIRDLPTTLKPGRYIEVHEGWPLDVQSDGKIKEWDVPGQTAVMFVPQP
jgi:alpha-amylase